MRVVVYLLVAVNLFYLAWAGWIDTPAPLPPPPPAQTETLPQLALLSEDVARPPGSIAGPSAMQTAATEPVTAGASSSSRCVSVGPFNDLAQAARAAALLRDRGFEPRQRAEQGEMWDGYWVYVGSLASAVEESKVIKALERNGIKDARVMPETGEGRRVSVGLFSERDRAEKRAQAVKRLGFNAEITERRQPGTVYWVDLEVGANERSVPTEGLLSTESAGSRLEIRVCPSPVAPPSPPGRPASPNPRDARPAATTADASSPRPG